MDAVKKSPTTVRLIKFLRRMYAVRYVYLIFLPVLAYYLFFAYAPMFNPTTGGILMSFKHFRLNTAFSEMKWVGLQWFSAMLFIQNTKLIPLVFLLRKLIIENSVVLGDAMANAMRSNVVRVHSRSLQFATVTVATLPILCIYPFLQQYFTKGIMLGSIKA